MLTIIFKNDICRDFDAAIQKEWIVTNGIGGYASSTIIGANSRRYHGLLVAATKPPLERRVLLSKLEETLVVGQHRYELSCNQYPGAIHPNGHKYLESFKLEQFPVFRYVIDDITLEKSVFMAYGENITLITYHLLDAPDEVKLELRPLLACRDYHHLSHENANFNLHVVKSDGALALRPYGRDSTVHLAYGDGEFHKSGDWYCSFEYPMEERRGQDCREDLYSPGYFAHPLNPGESWSIIASTEPMENFDPNAARKKLIERRKHLLKNMKSSDDDFLKQLYTSADSFIVKRGDSHTVIAGYHWFGDWGRDTMIALPGLTLVTGRFDVARGILKTFTQYSDKGMIPNRFPDEGAVPEYNTVDATLWMFHAVYKYLEYTQDSAFVEEHLYEKLVQIVDWHLAGTRYNIHVDEDGLLTAGDSETQLTWMDAKVDDWVVTPRRGKAVEVNALWYNALKIMESLATQFNDVSRASNYAQLAQKAKQGFKHIFWNEAENCLYDCIYSEEYDASMRPNQIFAVSLPYPLLEREKETSVVEVVQRELLTPFGLRSLSPKDQNYFAHYCGDRFSRDGAYHQGTVWAWLLGAFITAYVKVHDKTPQAQEEARTFIKPFKKHLYEVGLGTISEIFDGNPPHHPRGCISQAWSVAEILRACVEDVGL